MKGPLGALDASGKEPIRKPYTAWLGRFLHAPAAYEYRCGNPGHPDGCGEWHGTELERMISLAGAETVARMRQRVVDELKTTFASRYTATISLADVLKPEIAAVYERKSTGAKYLIDPSV